MRDYLEKVELFRGDLQEYERLKGYDCEIVASSISLSEYIPRTGPTREQEEIVEKGVEALIRMYTTSFLLPWGSGILSFNYHGIPVKRKGKNRLG